MLTGLGAGALLFATGCNPFSPTAVTSTVTASTPPPADPLPGLIATTRLHLVRLEAAIAADPADAPRLTPLRDDRQAHLDALQAEGRRTDPSAGSSTSGAATGTPSVQVSLPPDPEAIVSSVRGDAATAQVQFTDAMSLVPRYRAALLGSIAACLASHRAVLL